MRLLAAYLSRHGHLIDRLRLLGLAVGLGFAGVSSPGQLVRVANTTLTFPQNPQTFGFRTEAAFPGITFNQPLGLASAPGETDRVFVIEKTGRIQVVTGLNTTPAKQLFFDLTSRVLASDVTEEGLLGLAFHPDFANNHYFYIFYTVWLTTPAGTWPHERLSRFTALPAPATNADILATELPLISQWDDAANHNGGDLHFGPDGYLYVAVGDEGGADDQYNNSQRIDKDFFSGLLRIDVDQRPGNLAPNAHPSVHPGTYSIPADNPFVGATSFNGAAVTAANVRTEFWAVGLRNPWRFSFDVPTGRLLLGDVGQLAREEIDLITRGGNYGWNYREGTIAGPRSNPPAGASFIAPIWDTDRNTATSITGGVVYRGSRFAQLFERYVFGDYPSGRIFAMTFPPSGPAQVQQLLVANSPAGFGIDPHNGDVLIASLGTGAVQRLVYNSTPTGTPLPATLSATGAFTNLATLAPSAGLVAYEPNVSFWSDHAIKRRWFSVPALADKITFAADGNWAFPAGTVWAKHFDLELTRGDPATARRLETRFLVKTSAGIYGVTYRWNMAQTEATLVPEEGADETITINEGGVLRSQTWRYPSRAECLQCHTTVGGHALSFNTAQLNRTVTYGAASANQLTALANAGYLASSIPAPATLRALAPAGDASATLEHRARSYLAANCVQCHQPGGAAQGNWDARIATPIAQANLLGGLLVNNGGNGANRAIAPGDRAHSMLLTRISARGAGQMPPLASNELDTTDIALIASWIDSLAGPVITIQPQSQTAYVGATVTFSVQASGQPTYQWKKNGTNIPGATSASYTIASAQTADAGSYSVAVANGLGSVTSNVAVLTVIVPAALADFNGDGQSDLLWQNRVTGERYVYLMNGTDMSGAVGLGVLSPEWMIAATGDFNEDGKTDLVWQNTITGERYVYLMSGTTVIAGASLGSLPPAWSIAAAADFNGDGKTDVVWQNTVTGERYVYLMDGTNFLAGLSLGTVAPIWSIAGVADFNADGQPDLLWQNTATGEEYVWLMNGTSFSAGVSLGTEYYVQISGIGDYNSDGKPDILLTNTVTGERFVRLMNGTTPINTVSLGTIGLEWILNRPGPRRMSADFDVDGRSDLVWQNTTTGEGYVYLMNGTNFSSGLSLALGTTAQWQIAATADFNADGHPDLVAQNTVTGERVIWLMNVGSIASTVSLGALATEWTIAIAADLNADGKPDIVWQNTATGERYIYLMNGTTVSSGQSLNLGVNGQWTIAATADFNADGKPDLAGQNLTTGERAIWVMNGSMVTSTVSLGSVATAWTIAVAADLNVDGKPDLIWQNLTTGERYIYLMDGTTISSGVSLGTVATNWVIRR